MHSTRDQYNIRKVISLTPGPNVVIRFLVRLILDSSAEAAVAQTVFDYAIMIDCQGVE